MSETTWILIADASRARLLEHHRSRRSLELVFEEERPELRELERDSDRPGRVHESHGQTRHAMQPHSSPNERHREQYARELVERLRAGANEQRFGQLLLVASPPMLGALRSHLDEGLRDQVIGELDKDLTRIALHELPEHLSQWLVVAPAPRLANRT